MLATGRLFVTSRQSLHERWTAISFGPNLSGELGPFCDSFTCNLTCWEVQFQGVRITGVTVKVHRYSKLFSGSPLHNSYSSTELRSSTEFVPVIFCLAFATLSCIKFPFSRVMSLRNIWSVFLHHENVYWSFPLCRVSFQSNVGLFYHIRAVIHLLPSSHRCWAVLLCSCHLRYISTLPISHSVYAEVR